MPESAGNEGYLDDVRHKGLSKPSDRVSVTVLLDKTFMVTKTIRNLTVKPRTNPSRSSGDAKLAHLVIPTKQFCLFLQR